MSDYADFLCTVTPATFGLAEPATCRASVQERSKQDPVFLVDIQSKKSSVYSLIHQIAGALLFAAGTLFACIALGATVALLPAQMYVTSTLIVIPPVVFLAQIQS